MLVIHGVWRPEAGRLALWAEDAALPPRPPRRPGRPPRERSHPFAAGHSDLATALGDLAVKAATGTAVLSVPTRAGTPLDSPELVRTTADAPAAGRSRSPGGGCRPSSTSRTTRTRCCG